MSKIYDISDTENFKQSFSFEESNTILQGYTDLISEFLLCIVKKIHIHNTKYYIFVIQRGLETLKHCFKLILLYTKNLEIALYYSAKALCYYIEFIGQIGEDSNTFLQLNSKDAVLFVYKKTIFEIDNDFRKEFSLKNKEQAFLNVLTIHIDIFGEIIMNMLYLTEDNINNREDIITNAIKKGVDISSKLDTIKYSKEECKTILFFVTVIKDFVSNNSKYSDLCSCFTKKYKKKQITTDKIHEKLYRNECTEQLNKLTTLRFINWIFN